ncbi:SpoIID/LytB domain-containing protein [bacterium]|nr:SpoIID/LytB domain-containing protein [bacterium]
MYLAFHGTLAENGLTSDKVDFWGRRRAAAEVGTDNLQDPASCRNIRIGLSDVFAGESVEISSPGGVRYVCGSKSGVAPSVKLSISENMFGTLRLKAVNDKGKILVQSEKETFFVCPAEAEAGKDWYSSDDLSAFSRFACKVKRDSQQDTESYRGILCLSLKKGTKSYLELINRLALEDYLKGVVPCEAPDTFHPEALKTMACIARSYALCNLRRHEADGFDLCSRVHCQKYGGADKESDAVSEQIESTAGEVLYFGKLIANSNYFSTCGGSGEEPGSIWQNQANSYPYMKTYSDTKDAAPWYEYSYKSYNDDVELDGEKFKALADKDGFIENSAVIEKKFRYFIDSKPDCFCSGSNRFRWTAELTVEDFNSKLKESLPKLCGAKAEDIGAVTELKVAKRTKGGRCAEFDIVTDKGSFKVLGDEVRWIVSQGSVNSLSLNSALFYVDMDDKHVTFTGGGWGHGVGMCQYGMNGRAMAGNTYKDIISYYYPGCAVRSFNNF